MALVDKTIKREYVPHEATEANGGPHWVDIRQLSGAEMDEAQDARTAKVLDRMGSMMAALDKLPDPDRDKDSTEVRRQVYDPDILINHALQAWSYDDLLSDTLSHDLRLFHYAHATVPLSCRGGRAVF